MSEIIHILVLAGKEYDAQSFARGRYPHSETEFISKAALRESNWKSKLRTLRGLRGKALLIFTDSLSSLHEPLLLKWSVLVHRCQETVIADASGAFEVSSKAGLLTLFPRTIIAALADGVVFAFSWAVLKLFQLWLKLGREPQARSGGIDLAFLYPVSAGLDVPGGARTHVTGFLSGLAQEGARTVFVSGQPLQTAAEVQVVPSSRRLHLFREAGALTYNLRFILAARRLLKEKNPRVLYQRHGRFLFAGAILSRLLRIPLVLEYNGSENWIAKHWDPARFSKWLVLCERLSIQAASVIVVVSEALKQELMVGGIPGERVLVNPNAVDPAIFYPGCGGVKLRPGLGFGPNDVVVGFVGTFSYWHGIAVLEQAIRLLLDDPHPAGNRLKFVLVGNGLLAPQIRDALKPYVAQNRVVFTGTIAHDSIRKFMDAADILVSPHVPMPDGRPFFGSPTKLFEYMATGKAIAASKLDQIAEILDHGRTALLVTPGDPVELALAIRHLAANPELRSELGRNARAAVLARHTWRRNARRVLARFGAARTEEPPSSDEPAPDFQSVSNADSTTPGTGSSACVTAKD